MPVCLRATEHLYFLIYPASILNRFIKGGISIMLSYQNIFDKFQKIILTLMKFIYEVYLNQFQINVNLYPRAYMCWWFPFYRFRSIDLRFRVFPSFLMTIFPSTLELKLSNSPNWSLCIRYYPFTWAIVSLFYPFSIVP